MGRSHCLLRRTDLQGCFLDWTGLGGHLGQSSYLVSPAGCQDNRNCPRRWTYAGGQCDSRPRNNVVPFTRNTGTSRDTPARPEEPLWKSRRQVSKVIACIFVAEGVLHPCPSFADRSLALSLAFRGDSSICQLVGQCLEAVTERINRDRLKMRYSSVDADLGCNVPTDSRIWSTDAMQIHLVRRTLG